MVEADGATKPSASSGTVVMVSDVRSSPAVMGSTWATAVACLANGMPACRPSGSPGAWGAGKSSPAEATSLSPTTIAVPTSPLPLFSIAVAAVAAGVDDPAGRMEWLEGRREMTLALRDAISQASSVSTSSSKFAKVRCISDISERTWIGFIQKTALHKEDKKNQGNVVREAVECICNERHVSTAF